MLNYLETKLGSKAKKMYVFRTSYYQTKAEGKAAKKLKEEYLRTHETPAAIVNAIYYRKLKSAEKREPAVHII